MSSKHMPRRFDWSDVDGENFLVPSPAPAYLLRQLLGPWHLVHGEEWRAQKLTIRLPMQAHEANVRLRKELQLEQQRRQIAVGALVGNP